MIAAARISDRSDVRSGRDAAATARRRAATPPRPPAGQAKWTAVWTTADVDPDCKHQRQGGYYGLFFEVKQGCRKRIREKLEPFKNPHLPNRSAFTTSRTSMTVLALASVIVAAYYALTGLCGRVRLIERVAALAMIGSGGFALVSTGYWFYRFDKRPFDDDLTDDRDVCDAGCQMAFAAGGVSMILGFCMCCLASASDPVFGAPVAAEDTDDKFDLEMPPTLYRKICIADVAPCCMR